MNSLTQIRSNPLLLAISISAILMGNALGDIHINVSESGGDTTLSWEGSLDVSSFDHVGRVPAPTATIFPKMGVISGASASEVDIYHFQNTDLKPFGNGAGILATSTSGSPLLITNTLEGSLCVCLPAGYRGENLKGQVVFKGASMDDLGITEKPMSYDLGGQRIQFFGSSTPADFSSQSPREKEARQLSIRKPAHLFVKPGKKRKIGLLRLRTVFTKHRNVPRVEVRPIRS